MPIVLTLFLAVFARRNHCRRALRFNLFNQSVAVISLIREDGVASDVGNQRSSLTNIAGLACGQQETQAIAQAIYAQVELGRETTFAAP